MRFFKNLSDIDMNFSLFSGLGISRLFQSLKYYLQLFVLANFSLLAMKDFVSRMYYFNCFSFFLGFIMSKYILAEELAQTAVAFGNDLCDLYNNKVAGMLGESIDKFKTSVKNVLEKKPVEEKVDSKPVEENIDSKLVEEVTAVKEQESITNASIRETAEYIDQKQGQTE